MFFLVNECLNDFNFLQSFRCLFSLLPLFILKSCIPSFTLPLSSHHHSLVSLLSSMYLATCLALQTVMFLFASPHFCISFFSCSSQSFIFFCLGNFTGSITTLPFPFIYPCLSIPFALSHLFLYSVKLRHTVCSFADYFFLLNDNMKPCTSNS